MKSKITPRNIYAVIQAFFRRKRRKIAGFELPDHMYEQIIWRRTQVMKKSPTCWESGQCIVCGCDILGKTVEDRACSVIDDKASLVAGKFPCYPKMLSKENWEKYKELDKIKLFN